MLNVLEVVKGFKGIIFDEFKTIHFKLLELFIKANKPSFTFFNFLNKSVRMVDREILVKFFMPRVQF